MNEDSIGDTEGDLSKEHRAIFEQLKKKMVEGKKGDYVMFKKVDKMVLEVQTDRVNEAIKCLKNKSIKETNNLIKTGSVWMAERIGLKKVDDKKRN